MPGTPIQISIEEWRPVVRWLKQSAGLYALTVMSATRKSWTLETTSNFSSGMPQPGGTNLFLSALSGAKILWPVALRQ
jgi:hypothetical protein